MRIVFLLTILALSAGASAATVNKCVGADGSVTFTQTACPEDAAGVSVKVRVASEGMLIAPPAPITAPAQDDEKTDAQDGEPVIVGSRESSTSKCSDASAQEIRTAVVKNQVFPGMSAADAIKSWGEPSKINRSSRGSDQWVYYRGRVSAQYLYVDSAGCVTAWN